MRGNNKRTSMQLNLNPKRNIHSRVERCMPCTKNYIEGFNKDIFKNIGYSLQLCGNILHFKER